ncbi:MAG: MarR family transcriptional regulator [Novosphingobium sp.]|jgi:DNA-binding MarR family transcriptional regulator|nr:MarR family transcriptional regulator [Novosphingobium sp.]
MDIYGMPGHLIRRLQQQSTQVFAARMREAGFDITPVQFAAMDALAARPGIDQATLAQLIAYDRATIGGVVDRLEGKGLVERTISAADRRAREVRLTDEGSRVHAALLPIVRLVQQDIMAPVPPAEQAAFMAAMRRLVDGLG